MDMIATNLVALAVLKATLGGILEDNGKPVPTYFPDYVAAIQTAGNFQNRYAVTTIYGEPTKISVSLKQRTSWIVSNRIYLPDATSIPNNLFKGCSELIEVIAPNVTSIGNSAFEGCTMLKTVKFSDDIAYIGEKAFHGCGNLQCEFYAPEISKINNSAFAGCHYLKKITLSDSLHFIGDKAFLGCYKCDFSQLNFTHVTNIGYKAFYDASISQTPVSSEVTGISRRRVKDHAFYGSALVDPFFAKNSQVGMSSFGHTKLKSIDEFVDCGDRAFIASSITNFIGVANRGICMNCKDLVKVTFGSSNVDADAFRGCSSLKTLLNTSDVTDWIGEGAFAGCVSLSNITFENLEVCYEGCFSACINLEVLSLPSVTQFHAVFIPKYYASSKDEDEMLAKREAARKDGGIVNFTQLTKLTTLSLPSVQKISAFAFGVSETEQLTNIMDLYLPNLTTAQIKAMDTYPYWFLHPSCTIHASDGNFTYGN